MILKNKFKIAILSGARPNFVKIAPLISELKKYPDIFNLILINSGQHYDREMSDIFFSQLKIDNDYNLGIGSGNHGEQTARTIIALETILISTKPDLLIVVGDVNSTLAGALTAVKLNIPVAHIEAGLRSFDNSMPEEINRKITDLISNYLFISEFSANENLMKEGNSGKIYFVGNIMIDSLFANIEKTRNIKQYKKFNLKNKEYCLITIHRQENVDNKKNLLRIFEIINDVSKNIPIIFPLHPRTKKKIFDFKIKIDIENGIVLTEPLGYLEFINLMDCSKFVLTDSGGIQEETTALGIPCLTLRKNTERPVTVSVGTNTIVGINQDKINKEIENILNENYKTGSIPDLWDGKTAQRIVSELKKIVLNE